MEKIDVKVLFEGERVIRAWLFGMITFTLGLVFYASFRSSFLDGSLNFMIIVIWIGITLLTVLLTWLLGVNMSTKDVSFIYDGNNRILKVFYNHKEVFILNDFYINAEFQFRRSSDRYGMDSRSFFCLSIFDKSGKRIQYFEPLEEEVKNTEIKINPSIQTIMLIPTSKESFPGSIFKLYNVLKENHLERI